MMSNSSQSTLSEQLAPKKYIGASSSQYTLSEQLAPEKYIGASFILFIMQL